MTEPTIVYEGRWRSSPHKRAKDYVDLRCRPIPYWAHHAIPFDSLSAIRTLPLYKSARTVLMTDDGVASAMCEISDGKDCYYLDPHDGVVLRTPRNQLPKPLLILVHSFYDLPQFDLFVTGCSHVQEGDVFTLGNHANHFVRAFRRLEALDLISDKTCRIALAGTHRLIANGAIALTWINYAIVNGVAQLYEHITVPDKVPPSGSEEVDGR